MRLRKIVSFIFASYFTFFNPIFSQTETEQLIIQQDSIASFFRKTVLTTHNLQTLKLKNIEPDFKPGDLKDLELRLEINFSFDSYALTDTAKSQLDNFAKVLKDPEFQHLFVELAGHTCEKGPAEYNEVLSQRRVNSARDYLINAQKINPIRISPRAYGERLPLIPGAKTEVERAQNRRVVTYLPENRSAIERILEEIPNLGFRWAVLQYTNTDTFKLVEYDGSSQLKSEDEYRIFVRPFQKKYIYLYQLDSRGKGEWLFPRDDIALKNPVMPGNYFLPDNSRLFVLDHNVGKETIFLVVTDTPVEELEALLENDTEASFPEAVEHAIKTRGLEDVIIKPWKKNQTVIPKDNQVVVSSEGQREFDDKLELRIPQKNIVNIMAQYREFFTVLEFEHK